MPEVVNNKELIPMEHYLAEYAKADPQKMAERSGFPYDAQKQCFDAVFLGRHYCVTWPGFEITAADDSSAYSPLLDTNQSKILMIRYLLEGTRLDGTGKFLTYRDVPWGEVYYRQFSGRCLSRLAFSYGNRLEQYREKMLALGAQPVATSDAGFAYEVFPGYVIQFLLWEGEDELPPSAQILFSDNFAAAFHAEDLVVAAELMISALKKA